MDEIRVSVKELRAHDGRRAFASIWCSRAETGNAVDASSARFTFPSASEPVVIVVGVYCEAKDDDGGTVTHTLGTVKIDASKAKRRKRYIIYDSTSESPIRTGEAVIDVSARLKKSVPWDLPLDALRRASEANLQHIAPYGNHRALEPCAPHLDRIHAPYFRTSAGTMLPSGAFLLPQAVVEDVSAVRASMASRLQTVLHRHGLTENEFVEKVQSRRVSPTLLRVLVETLSYATLTRVRYTPDTQLGNPTDRWETVRLPGSYTGDCEDCAKDIVLECMEWRRHADPSGARGIDALAWLLDLYVPVMVQGAVAYYRHSKTETAGQSYLNHEWAALHPRVWFEHMTGLATHKVIDPIHAQLPTLVIEGTGEVFPFAPPTVNVQLAAELEAAHAGWSAADTSYHFYHVPVACSTPLYADQGVIDFVYTSHRCYGVPFDAWIKRDHGIIVAVRHTPEIMQALRRAMSLERPIRAYTDQVRVLRVPKRVGRNFVRVGYTCSDDADEVHQQACAVAARFRSKGLRVEAQVARFDNRYVCEWYFNT